MPVLCVNTSTLGVVTLHLSGLDPRRSCVHPVTMRWVFGMNFVYIQCYTRPREVIF